MRRLEMRSSFAHMSYEVGSYIQEPLTEAEILDLQDVFLTNGFHHLQVPNVAAGRRLIKLFLQSLHCYNDISCLTTTDNPLEPAINDLYGSLLRGGFLDRHRAADLEEFFLECFYVDFMWVEATDTLTSSHWYTDFEKKVKELKLDHHIPIVMLSYLHE